MMLLTSTGQMSENPYGAYRVETTLGGATCGTLETDDDYQKFVSEDRNRTSHWSKIHEISVPSVTQLFRYCNYGIR